MDDLIARLRAMREDRRSIGGWHTDPVNPDGEEAADTIERLAKERDELAEALRELRRRVRQTGSMEVNDMEDTDWRPSPCPKCGEMRAAQKNPTCPNPRCVTNLGRPTLSDTPPTMLVLYKEAEEIGRLEIGKSGKMTFTGDAEASAQAYFDYMVGFADTIAARAALKKVEDFEAKLEEK